jgi:hypothetical protein
MMILRTKKTFGRRAGAGRPAVIVLLLLGYLLCFATIGYSTTWDEPWHKQVVAAADNFGLYEVVSSSPERAVFKTIRQLAGIDSGSQVEIVGFNGAKLVSSSTVNGRPTGEFSLGFSKTGRYYLFLQKSKSGNTWTIATPTTGYAEVQSNGLVAATYRISMHQAEIDAASYELTQICIFRKLHGQEKCSPETYKFIDDQLALPPGPLGPNSSKTDGERFFHQHAALETAYIAGYPVPLETLSKFLADSVVHTQISAVRALAATPTRERNAKLLGFVMDKSRTSIARVFAVLMLRENNARELKDQVAAYLPQAPADETGLGMNIMDPRVGTSFPGSVKSALQELLTTWNR